MSVEEDIEQTLHICREVYIYRIPPRSGATGFRSGEWRVGDKIFTGRLRVVAKGELCEVRIEDTSNGDLFAVCPVPPGKRDICVEPVSDSSRYYVLRIEDPSTKRHAFLGMGFAERGDAFDFSVALSDHEKHIQRAKASESASASGARSPGAGGQADEAVAALYKDHGDLSLKEGQTIRINVAKPAPKPGGLMSRVSGGGSGTTLAPLGPPPPAAAGRVARVSPPPISPPSLSPPNSARSSQPAAPPQPPPQPRAANNNLLNFDDLLSGSTASLQTLTVSPRHDEPTTTATAAVVATSQDNWATFD